jgi:hypothetical protein
MTLAAFNDLEELFERLTKKQQIDFIEYIENILEKRELNYPLYFDSAEMDDENFFIDFGPFGAPKIMPDRHKQKKPVQPAQPTGKQLNLFDDEL